MRTAESWISVLVFVISWCGITLKAGIEPVVSRVDILAPLLAGLWTGLVATFGWRAFRWPLILPNICAFVGYLLVFATVKNDLGKAT